MVTIRLTKVPVNPQLPHVPDIVPVITVCVQVSSMSEALGNSGTPNKKQRADPAREVSSTSYSSGLYHNLSFILCGLVGDDRREIEYLITSNNGVVIKSFPATTDMTSIIVITYPTGCRRPNYLLALALNIPLVLINLHS